MSGTVSILAGSRHESRIAGLCLGLLAWPWTAAAAEDVQVRCPPLSSEQAAEVEARVRASLLVAEIEGSVSLSCEPERARVEVVSKDGSATLEAPFTSTRPQEALIELVEKALRDLGYRRRTTPDAAASTVTTPVAALSTPAPPSPLPVARRPKREPQRAAPSSSKTPTTPSLQLSAQALGEVWATHQVAGGALGIGRSAGHLWYGAKLGVTVPVSGGVPFLVTEWYATLRLGFQPTWAAGAQLTFGAGPSYLAVASHDATVSGSTKILNSWFVDGSLSYPVWLKHVAFVPALGARLFGSERGVRVDTQERLVLRGVVPQLAFGVAYRLD
jgi:hypothetical protein